MEETKNSDEIEEQFPNEVSVCLVDHDDFIELIRESKLGQIATPAITSLKVDDEIGEIVVTQIVINESFLPEGDDFSEFLEFLVRHELYEARLLAENHEYLQQAQEFFAVNSPEITRAHSEAVKYEYELASERSLLDIYHNHWKDWLEDQALEMDEGSAKEATMARMRQREEVYQEILERRKIEAREKGIEKEI